jgi:hypothetical protein
MLPLARKTVIAGAVLGVLLATGPARADYFIWQDTCTSDSWYACCEVLGDNYNNWSLTPTPSCPTASYPGAADDVDLLAYSVYLDNAAAMWSLVTGGPFRLLNGDASGQLSVYTSATFNDDFYFDGGALAGFSGWPSSFEINHLVAFRTASLKNIVVADFNVNDGAAAVVLGDGDIVMGQAVLRIRPLATFEFDTDAAIVNNPYVGGYRVDNEGLFQKSAGTGTSRVDVPLNNTGTVAVHTGILRLNAESGTSSGAFEIDAGAVLEFAGHTLAPGATFAGDGLVRVPDPGHVILAAGAASSITDFEMAGGYSVVLGSGDLQITETLNWLGGYFETSGTTLLAATCATTLSGSAEKGALFGTLNNAGTLTWTGDGALNLAYGTLNNLAGASFTVQTDADALYGGTFNNAGTFTKLGSFGETVISAVFNNTNLVDVQSGRLTVSGYAQTAGTTKLNGGDIQCSDPLHLLGGVLTGSGTVYGAGVNNDGAVVRPGLSPGTIVVNGTYTQAAGGTLDIEVGGTAPGTQYDQLIGTGLVMLDGTINIALIDGFVPDPGAEFEVVTYPVHYGEFAAVHLPPPVSTRRFGLFVEPTSAVLRVALRGDLNCDGSVNFGDINPFVLLLSNPAAWQAAYPACPSMTGDINGDGSVGFGDINPFVALLSGK